MQLGGRSEAFVPCAIVSDLDCLLVRDVGVALEVRDGGSVDGQGAEPAGIGRKPARAPFVHVVEGGVPGQELLQLPGRVESSILLPFAQDDRGCAPCNARDADECEAVDSVEVEEVGRRELVASGLSRR